MAKAMPTKVVTETTMARAMSMSERRARRMMRRRRTRAACQSFLG
jgi:hypothetical protein